jgi:hypothetical protein
MPSPLQLLPFVMNLCTELVGYALVVWICGTALYCVDKCHDSSSKWFFILSKARWSGSSY